MLPAWFFKLISAPFWNEAEVNTSGPLHLAISCYRGNLDIVVYCRLLDRLDKLWAAFFWLDVLLSIYHSHKSFWAIETFVDFFLPFSKIIGIAELSRRFLISRNSWVESILEFEEYDSFVSESESALIGINFHFQTFRRLRSVAPAHLFCFDAQLAGSAGSSVQLMPVIQFYSIQSVWFVSNAAI